MWLCLIIPTGNVTQQWAFWPRVGHGSGPSTGRVWLGRIRSSFFPIYTPLNERLSWHGYQVQVHRYIFVLQVSSAVAVALDLFGETTTSSREKSRGRQPPVKLGGHVLPVPLPVVAPLLSAVSTQKRDLE